jgi:hypothetical protein
MLTDHLLEEIEAGEGETLTRAARRVPRTRQDRPVTLGCLIRWVVTGVIGPTGERVHLEAARLAGKWITTPGAIRRFIQAQTPFKADGTSTSCTRTQQRMATERAVTRLAPRSPVARRRASERAAQELEKVGI